MDFPLQLIPNQKEDGTPPVYSPGIGSNLEFVYGLQELQNSLYLLLKTIKGRFLQNINLGTIAVPHTVEDEFVESAVVRCCEQIQGCSCESVGLIDDFIVVRVTYQGRVEEFSFSVASL